jgi:hypothetical protein
MQSMRSSFDYVCPSVYGAHVRSSVRYAALAAFMWLSMSFAGVHAASSSNAQSPLGIDLQGIAYYSTENPFMNIFPNSQGWVTNSQSTWDTGEEQYLQVDANGYPTSLTASAGHAQQFTNVVMLMLYGLPSTPNGCYPAGNYVVLYDGAGTMHYGLDATLVSSSPGRDVINVANPSSGISLSITSTDPSHTGNYLRNIRVVQASNEAALTGGQVFNPGFLASIQNFRVLRFMDWLSTNNSPLSSWANRPLPTNAFYGTSRGVPLEVAVQAANAVSADAWLNVPHLADDNYVTQMATLVHSQLGTSQKVYLEYSNEVWNSMFTQETYAQTQGQALFASGLGSPYDYNRNWYGMRVAQICDIWKSVWGADAGRVVCVMGAQVANPYTATESLKCPFWKSGAPCSGHGIGAVAVAPYFGGPVPAAWASQSDGGLNSLFASLTSQNDPSIPVGGWLGQVAAWEIAYGVALAPYKLPLLAYEGGQTFQGFPNYKDGTPQVNLYKAANVDPRMGAAYTTFLNQWKANGGTYFLHFTDTSAYNQYGEWGALLSFMVTTTPLSSAPPKWQALQNFIAGNACWWSGCTGTASSSTPVPMAPAGLKVQ